MKRIIFKEDGAKQGSTDPCVQHHAVADNFFQFSAFLNNDQGSHAFRSELGACGHDLFYGSRLGFHVGPYPADRSLNPAPQSAKPFDRLSKLRQEQDGKRNRTERSCSVKNEIKRVQLQRRAPEHEKHVTHNPENDSPGSRAANQQEQTIQQEGDESNINCFPPPDLFQNRKISCSVFQSGGVSSFYQTIDKYDRMSWFIQTSHNHGPMSEANRSLDDIRRDIDGIDEQVVSLLSRRVELAQEVGRVKGKDNRPYFTPERERQIFEKLERINPGPLANRQLQAIFREIISAARAAEKALVAAYWGPPGTYTHLATIQTFGMSAEFKPEDTIQDVFASVEHGNADYGVVPVENSVAGIVPETLDMFPQTNVKICAEMYVPIQHHLVSTAANLGEIERIYAFGQPYQQCKRWVRGNLPNAEVIEVAPTAKAAQRALEDPHGAAICNRLAAETVGIPILVEHIADNPSNRTRFIVIGYNEPAKTGRDKTSFMFNVRNRPGTLVAALKAFEENGVNLMMIESRPAQRATFEYIFYCDCNGHRTDPGVQSAIEDLRKVALEVVILGSYPYRDPLDI